MTIGRRWLQLLIVVLVASSMGQVSQCNPSEEDVERYFSTYHGYTPQWTPDGQMLILGRSSNLYSLDTNTGELVALSVETSGPDILQVDYSPSLSPDGTRIAFSTTRFVTDGYYSYDIAVADIDGRRAKQLTPSTAREINPSWSPDGSRIAFLSNRDTESRRGSFNLFTMRDDGSNVVSVAPGIAMVDGPFAWSPDGDKLAFIGQIELLEGNMYRFSLYIARADGSGTEFVWDGFEGFIKPSLAVFPLMAWSPDGSQIAISNPHHSTYVINATDGIPRKLANAVSPRGLFWTADGEEILYFSKGVGVIHAIPVDGGTPYVRLDLVDQRRSGGFMDGTLYVSASPDRTRIASYSNPRDNVASLGIIDLDGSVTQLIEASDWPDYSPDFN